MLSLPCHCCRRELLQVAGRAQAAEAALQQQAAEYEARLAQLQAWYGKQAAVAGQLRKGKRPAEGSVGFINSNRCAAGCCTHHSMVADLRLGDKAFCLEVLCVVGRTFLVLSLCADGCFPPVCRACYMLCVLHRGHVYDACGGSGANGDAAWHAIIHNLVTASYGSDAYAAPSPPQFTLNAGMKLPATGVSFLPISNPS